MHTMDRQPRHLKIPALDGFNLAASLWEPAVPNHQASLVVINAATGIKRGYYDSFANFLSENGCHVLTYDYRGIGESRPPELSGFQAWMHEWGEQDFAGILDWTKSNFPRHHIIVIGHSAGGQIVGLAGNNQRISSLLLVAAQSGYWRLWPSPIRYGMFLIWYVVVPVLTRTFGYLPAWAGAGAALPAGVANEWAEWCRCENYLVGGKNATRRNGFSRLALPIMAYSMEDDSYAPRTSVESLLELFTSGAKTMRHIKPGDINAKSIGHFGFFRPRFKSSLWQEALQWILSYNRINALIEDE